MTCRSDPNTFVCVCVSERNVRRVTRALKNTVLQQHVINVDKALQILDQEIPPLVVDKVKLKVRALSLPLVLLLSLNLQFLPC